MPADRMRIVFSPKARARMVDMVNTHSTEVAWHATVDRISDREFAVDDILLYPQETAGNAVTTDEAEYAKWLASQPDEVFGRLRLQAHSHVNMPVSPSPADLDQQALITRQLSGEDYYIFMIVNKRFEAGVRIRDLKTGRTYDGRDIDLVMMDDETARGTGNG